MLFYQDGRFAFYKMFSFFALNFIMQRKNQNQGRFFMKTFFVDCPTSIDEMKKRIMARDTKFLSQMQYFLKILLEELFIGFKKIRSSFIDCTSY